MVCKTFKNTMEFLKPYVNVTMARSTLQSRRFGGRTSARPMVSSNVDRALIDDHVVYGVSSGEALELEVCAWNGCNVSILVDGVVVDGGI